MGSAVFRAAAGPAACLLLALPALSRAEGEPSLAEGRGWRLLPLPGEPAALAPRVHREALSPVCYASRRAMIRVLAELYLLARGDAHRRSPATWAACAALARQEGCDPAFCGALADMARDDLSARERAELRMTLSRMSRAQGIDELALRQWIELLNPAPERIRQAMDKLPLGDLFWLEQSGEGGAAARQQVSGATSPALAELLELLGEQVTLLSQVRDAQAADAAAADLLPGLLHFQAMRASADRLGLPLISPEAPPEQMERFEALRQSLIREWQRLRENGFYASANLMIVESLLAVS